MKAILVVLASALLLVGCDAQNNDGAGDAPISSVQDSGWLVINAPDRYANVAFRCYGPDGIYIPRNSDNSTSRYIQVVPNDANCPKGP